jgi:hypothetical protein
MRSPGGRCAPASSTTPADNENGDNNYELSYTLA